MATRSAKAANGTINDKLMNDMQAVVRDAEELLKATAGQAGEKVAAARERIQANLAVAKDKLADAEYDMTEKTKQAARATDDFVHENPWQAVGIAAGVSLILGMLISRGH